MNGSILHIRDMAGVSRVLSKYQRKLGYKSDTLDFRYNKYDYGIDFYFPRKTHLPTGLERSLVLKQMVSDYDIFHFHTASATKRGFDLPVWKAFGKKVIVHYHGSRIRGKKEKFFYKTFSDHVFVSTPDLLKYTANGIWIPNPADLEKIPFVGVSEKQDCINIVHSPTNRKIKGTEYVIESVRQLKSEGYNINLILVENLPHEKALEIYKKADIVVDWINLIYGIYGVVSIESMALGKPVICSIDQEFIDNYYKNLPIVNADKTNLVEKIRILIEDLDLRKKLSEEGRKYVEKMHDGEKIAEKIISHYEQI